MQYDLFKTRIWKYNSGSMFLSLESYIKDLVAKDKGRTVSNVASWQSNGTLANADEFDQFVKYVKTMVTEPLIQYGIDTLNISISIDDLWANVSPKNGFNIIHDHSGDNNFFSFVYYIATNNENGFINFKTEVPSTKFINLPKSTHTDLNSDTVNIKVEPGDLIIFPAWLEHFTMPNSTDDIRVSIAGNIKVK
mgnify:CR=1 FL=1